jgi:predicted  nucleic acid-binding Zn-ribbon protein
VGKELTALCQDYDKLSNNEAKFDKVEKAMASDLSDMVEYVKMLTDQIIVLRRRSKAAENVMHQLRKSGQSSIEALLETLVTLKKKQEKLDLDLGTITAQV